jgi:hypothetical protein
MTTRINRRYTEAEEAQIRAIYPLQGAKAVQSVIGGTLNQIGCKARTMGLRRPDDWNDNKTDMSWLMHPVTPEAAYVLGMIWADGSLWRTSGKYRVTLSLCADDFSDIHKMFPEWAMSVLHINGPYQVAYAAVLCHKQFCLFLERHDYLVKSSAAPIKILDTIPNGLHRYFYRGWFDGDGNNSCLDRDFGYVSISGALDQDWSSLILLAQALGVSYDIRKGKNVSGAGSSFAFNGRRSSIRFMRYIYSGVSFGLTRKLASWKRYRRAFLSELRIRRLKPQGVYRSATKNTRYNAYSTSSHKTSYLGVFVTKEEASIARDDHCYQAFADETKLNDPTRVIPDYLDTFGVPKDMLND